MKCVQIKRPAERNSSSIGRTRGFLRRAPAAKKKSGVATRSRRRRFRPRRPAHPKIVCCLTTRARKKAGGNAKSRRVYDLLAFCASIYAYVHALKCCIVREKDSISSVGPSSAGHIARLRIMTFSAQYSKMAGRAMRTAYSNRTPIRVAPKDPMSGGFWFASLHLRICCAA